MAPKILVGVRKLSDKPIRYIINTHVHTDHSGGNEAQACRRIPERLRRPPPWRGLEYFIGYEGDTLRDLFLHQRAQRGMGYV